MPGVWRGPKGDLREVPGASREPREGDQVLLHIPPRGEDPTRLLTLPAYSNELRPKTLSSITDTIDRPADDFMYKICDSFCFCHLAGNLTVNVILKAAKR